MMPAGDAVVASADAVVADVARLRRGRRGKASVFTKTVSAIESLLGENASKRLLARNRQKLEKLFLDVQAVGKQLIETLENQDDDDEYEAACVWLNEYEATYDTVSCKIDDELAERSDEAKSSAATSVSSYVSKAIEQLQIDGAGSAMAKVAEEIPPFDDAKQIIAPVTKTTFDDWIDGLADEAPTQTNNEMQMSDTLVGLNLKLQTFAGEPLEYHQFITSFRHQIHDRKSLPACAKMAHLIGHLDGAAKLAVEGFPADEKGYFDCLKTIKDLFGNKIVVSRAHLNRVTKGDPISAKDPKQLRTMYHEVYACWSALARMEYYDDANATTTLIEIVKRLPFRTQERWKHQVARIRQKSKTPGFEALVDFLKQESLSATDPVWGDIGSNPSPTEPKGNKGQPVQKGYKSGKVFAATKRDCIFCGEQHDSWLCKSLPATHAERRNAVFAGNACFNCLRPGHMVVNCPSQRSCSTCRKKHHSLLHRSDGENAKADKAAGDSPKDTPPSPAPGSPPKEAVSATAQNSAHTFLQVVAVNVFGPKGSAVVNALLDTGSQVTMLSDKLAAQIGAKGAPTTLDVTTVMGRSTPKRVNLVSLSVQGISQEERLTISHAYAVKGFSLPHSDTAKQDIRTLSHLKGVPLGKQIPGKDVELLIGANAGEMLLPLECKRGNPGEPVAIRTPLGWTLFGGRESTINQRCNAMSCSVSTVVSSTTDEQLKKLWSTEDFGTKHDFERPMSQEDVQATLILARAELVDGHYEMPLLWKDADLRLPNNKKGAVSRLSGVKRRFERDADFKKLYCAVVEDYIKDGHATAVGSLNDVDEVPGKTWYLPHHGVTNLHKPGKLRVVFDAAARYAGTSLNENLLSGPDYLNSLLGCILRFRQRPVALMADVKSMFHQVFVAGPDRNALRFLWWEGGDTTKEPLVHRMNVHIFGAISSPCCAITALRRTATDNEESFGKEVSEIVKNNFYMDDLLLSVEDADEAINMATKLTEILKCGGFRLMKWVCNDRDVTSTIPESERSPKMQDLSNEEELTERALGVKWDVKEDVFRFTTSNFEKPATKRGLLSLVSSIFNPDGVLSPMMLVPKLLLRELWQQQLGWDDPMPEEQLVVWTRWLAALPAIESVAIPRHFGNGLKTDHWDNISLHVFCDASEKGFGAVVYLRYQREEVVHCSFVVGKSRCAPLKQLTIPRLELQAAVLGCRMTVAVTKELQLQLDEVTLWSDSMTTLAYIRNSTRRFQTFVANRVTEIRDVTTPKQWRHCPGQLNVADDASRGLDPSELTQSCRWLRGPDFLWGLETNWPAEATTRVPDSELEIKKDTPILAATTPEEDGIDHVIKRHSSWYGMKRVIAQCHRLFSQSSSRSAADEPSVTVDHLEKAEMTLVRRAQRDAYGHELDCLKQAKKTGNGSPHFKSNVSKLCPYIDEQEVMRVGSRIKFADLPDATKQPMIIPPTSLLADAIIRDAHERMAHGGVDSIIAEVRQRFWIPHLRSKVKKLSLSCIPCRKQLAKKMEQLMAPLPTTRVTATTPFDVTGVDYFGPFMVKVKRSLVKRWGCVFTCFSTRAVHLESTSSMDTDHFIGVLRRFKARRGSPTKIYSDNGTNFVGAEREMKSAIDEWNHDAIRFHLQQDHTEWHFNPPAAPHMGGVWERIVRSVKRSLKAVLRQQVVDQESFDVVLAEIEGILNARPLTSCSDDVLDLEPLTPNHFLLLKSSPVLPPGKFGATDLLLRKSWRRSQAVVDHFWGRWHREYLTTLHERTKWTSPRPNVDVGDMVLVAEDNVPRGHWRMARVVQTHPGSDGIVRTVKVKTATTELTRPIAKLCLLENARM